MSFYDFELLPEAIARERDREVQAQMRRPRRRVSIFRFVAWAAAPLKRLALDASPPRYPRLRPGARR